MPTVAANAPVIYGPDGQPWRAEVGSDTRAVKRSVQSFMQTLMDLSKPPVIRASEPLKNHAWVYVGAMALAINLVQAEFGVKRETKKARELRRDALIQRGMESGAATRASMPRSGKDRRAVARHLNTSARLRGAKFRNVEDFIDHPLTPVFQRPNDIITSGDMLWTATVLWLTLRGECFWLMVSESGQPLQHGEIPAEIHVLNPDAFQPQFSGDTFVGWRFIPRSRREGGPFTRPILLGHNEVVHFKYFNPENPLRGLAPIEAAAAGIELDMLAQRSDRSAILNGNNPGGVLQDAKGQVFANAAERRHYEDDFNAKYGGPEANRRALVLEAGLEWVPIGMTPAEMERLEMRRWNRDEVLAVIGAPKASVGITDDLPYAAQVVQDRNLWRNRLLPLCRLLEAEIDGTIFFPETDDVFAAFDTSQVEALRAGLNDQITMADKLAGPNLHMPPEEALRLVGIDHEGYEGSDTALASPVLAPVKDIIAGTLILPAGQAPAAGEDDAAGGDRTPVGDGGTAGNEPKAEALTVARQYVRVLRAKNASRYWQGIIRSVFDPMERVMAPAWVKWVMAERKLALARFDKATRGLKSAAAASAVLRVGPDDLDLDAILGSVGESRAALASASQGFYHAALEETFNFTATTDLGGVPVFGIDDPRLLQMMEAREAMLLGTAPQSVQAAVRRTLGKGLAAGETVQELRARVARVYDINASTPKALMVARTETAGMVNGVRDTMFGASGFTGEEWITAEDENVRKSHEVYGNAGTKARGFDYLTLRPSELPRASGHLRFPSDPQGPADEVINCRCVKVPVE